MSSIAISMLIVFALVWMKLKKKKTKDIPKRLAILVIVMSLLPYLNSLVIGSITSISILHLLDGELNYIGKFIDWITEK